MQDYEAKKANGEVCEPPPDLGLTSVGVLNPYAQQTADAKEVFKKKGTKDDKNYSFEPS